MKILEKIKICTEKAGKPGGWYSQGFKVGKMIYTAGITAIDPKTQMLVSPNDITGQTKQVLTNMKAILEAAGSDMNHVVKTLVFISDINDFQKFNEVYKEFFPIDPPARSTVQIGRFKDEIVIEIEAIATVID